MIFFSKIKKNAAKILFLTAFVKCSPFKRADGASYSAFGASSASAPSAAFLRLRLRVFMPAS